LGEEKIILKLILIVHGLKVCVTIIQFRMASCDRIRIIKTVINILILRQTVFLFKRDSVCQKRHVLHYLLSCDRQIRNWGYEVTAELHCNLRTERS
jgi:hypothetical protein